MVVQQLTRHRLYNLVDKALELIVGSNSSQTCADLVGLFTQMSQAKSFSHAPALAVDGCDDVSKGETELLAIDLKPRVCENEPSQQEGVSSTLCLPDVA